MSLIETVKDYEFAGHIGVIARELGNIATELKARNEADYSEASKMSDETFKEILSSYPAEDLLDLLNYDQKNHVYYSMKAESVAEDVAGRMHDCYSHVADQLSEGEIHALCVRAGKRYSFDGKYDCSLDYWAILMR